MESKYSISNINKLAVAQYIAAMLVIVLHSGQFLNNPELNFFVKNIICRLAVPLFMMVTSYFYRLNIKKSDEYARTYFKKQLKTYLFWSLVYLPIGCHYIFQQGYPWYAHPAALLIGFIYFGTWYHLWYIPAVLFGIFFISLLIKKFGYKITILLASTLYLIGAVETYSAYVGQSLIGTIYEQYARYFITTRNGLFFACAFVLVGFILADYQGHPYLKNNLKLKFSFSFLLLCLEGWIVFQNPGYDKIFLIALIPVSFFLVAGLLKIPNKEKCQMTGSFLRPHGRYLFFLHPIIIEGVQFISRNINGASMQGIQLFLMTAGLTTLLIKLILAFKIKIN